MTSRLAVRNGLFRDLFDCLDNRSGSDAKVVDEFVRLPAVWDRADGELMHLDAFWSDRAEHSIPEAAVGIMIFNGEDASLRGSGAVQ